MVERVRHMELEGDLAVWKRLYCNADGVQVTDEDIDLIASPNPLIGWAAANFVRRGNVFAGGEERIRAIYTRHGADTGKRSVRWRVVHALGAHPSDANLDLLAEALATDEYRWVLYGAARSLVEAGATLQDQRLVIGAQKGPSPGPEIGK
jgi:hypothetical protein